MLNFQTINKFFKKYFFAIFLTSLFLITIPPLYIFPLIKNNILMTYTIVAVMVSIMFFFILIESFTGRKKFGTKNKNIKLLLIFFIIYFAFQTLSVVNAFSLEDFLHNYKNILIAGVFLFVTVFLKENIKDYYSKVIIVLFASAIFNFIYQMLIFFAPDIFVTIGSVVVYSNHLNLVFANMLRGRIFIETYDEILIPFIFIFFLETKKNYKNIMLALSSLAIIVLPSFLSDFRTRILMLIFSLGLSIIFLQKAKLSRILILIFLLSITYLAYFILNINYGYSFIDRLNFQSRSEDVETVDSRVKNILYSYDLGIKNPLTGVGLGNYYINLPIQKNSNSDSNNPNTALTVAAQNPHNIFAQIFSETGFFSLLFYVFIILYFLITDLSLIRKNKTNRYSKAFIISFWTLFIYSVFNPTIGLTYNILFWMLRASVY